MASCDKECFIKFYCHFRGVAGKNWWERNKRTDNYITLAFQASGIMKPTENIENQCFCFLYILIHNIWGLKKT